VKIFPDRKEKVEVDVVDIVNDPIDNSKYKAEEDPKLYTSKKSGRGPLDASWRVLSSTLNVGNDGEINRHSTGNSQTNHVLL